MTGSLHVISDELRAHAQHTRAAQAATNLAVDAAHQVTPGGWANAYGVICQFFPLGVRPLAEIGIDIVKRISESLGLTADQLGQTADAYQRAEEDQAHRMRQIHDRMDGNAKPPAVAGAGPAPERVESPAPTHRVSPPPNVPGDAPGAGPGQQATR
ncbi:type VII secretion target [Gandjariella thermophila]|uniref:ESX-1 secretion-associated protein n=1 Tax=Gandjariella thermophila TaxID=1931992 RepID=A0A4D4JEM4_9PSEU|nr:type VII secretion target [Gandjariella thermophila]GDY32303.1 hypothetical protein GTS_39360 [Gandjariella thermophila]